MGEIMRWRLSRGAQRRIPAPESIVPLETFSQITTGDQASIESATADNAVFAARFQSISKAVALRQPLPPLAACAPPLSIALFNALLA